MSIRTLPGDRVIDDRYSALSDPTSDKLLSLLLSLTAEVWTVRDRLRLVEGALAEKGLDLQEIIESGRNSAEQLGAMRAERDAFVERVFVALTSSGNVEAP